MKNILIMVDVQNGFVKNEYSEIRLRRIEKLLGQRLFDLVIATKYWNRPGSFLSRFMGWNDLCTEKEQDLRQEVKEYADFVLLKDIYSSVNDEMLSLLRRECGGSDPEYVFILGFDTECCVLTTAVDFFESGIRPLVLTHYCGSHDGDRFHDAGIISMEHLIGPDFLIEDELKTREDLRNIIERVMGAQRENDIKAYELASAFRID